MEDSGTMPHYGGNFFEMTIHDFVAHRCLLMRDLNYSFQVLEVVNVVPEALYRSHIRFLLEQVVLMLDF